LNCALGATLMRPYAEELSKISETYVCIYPNAGLPNPMSDTGFDETPDVTSSLLKEFAESGFVNIAGGCCGTTPDHIKAIAEKYKDASDFLFLGRGYNFPVALEGALKLKEISYIHAEGYPAAEMKHGPIALVDENLPVVFIATKDPYHEKIVSNMQEIKARKGKIISIYTEGDTTSPSLSNDSFAIPPVDELIAPILTVIPLQLLSYYVGVAKGIDVDKPRNLAKSVTVE
jgi:glucosamine 6-phosphate synthetase-like amidotransferase/phosphosugar isomerase protein